MRKNISGIYIILNTKTNKVYIGQAQDIRLRWGQHKSQLRGGYHDNEHLQNSWNKHGEKSFNFKILERCLIDDLDNREQHYLDIYLPKGICYNISIDATSPMRGRKASKETTEKRVAKIIGRHHTEEAKQRIRNSQLGQKRKPLSEEHKRKIGDAAKNISQDAREKLRIAFSGENNPNFGKHVNPHKNITEETRVKMSEACKNRPPISEETRQRMCMAAKERWEVRRGRKNKSNE